MPSYSIKTPNSKLVWAYFDTIQSSWLEVLSSNGSDSTTVLHHVHAHAENRI